MRATLIDRLAQGLAQLPVQPSAYVIAFSGGVDSAALLAGIRELALGTQVRAIHVDHRLNPDSHRWAEFCRDLAERYDVPLQTRIVDCSAHQRESIEAAARRARYAVFEETLAPDEALLTAHHADDQFETLLYRLVRGTGTDGLRGIRGVLRFGAGWLLRPLLDISRAEILEFARDRALEWLDDPANADTRFDRNFLRHRIVPEIAGRWPKAAFAAARLAAAAEDSAELAAALAQIDAADIESPDCLPVASLAGLSPARLRNVLRYAVRSLGLALPDAAALERIAALAATGAANYAAWPGAEAHRHAGALYLRAARRALPRSGALHPDRQCAVGDGTLVLLPSDAPALPERWVRDGLQVRFRTGGERFHAAGSRGPCDLREWMRLQRFLPWMRDRVPLIFHGEELVAVADLGLCAAAAEAARDTSGWSVVWRQRPRVSAMQDALSD